MPHTKSAAELLELGRAYYSERSYEKALRAFMEVCDALNPPWAMLTTSPGLQRVCLGRPQVS